MAGVSTGISDLQACDYCGGVIPDRWPSGKKVTPSVQIFREVCSRKCWLKRRMSDSLVPEQRDPLDFDLCLYCQVNPKLSHSDYCDVCSDL